MIFTTAFNIFGALAALTAVAYANPVANIASYEEIMHWLATTDANVTHIGEPFEKDLTRRNALNTVVVHCDKRIDNLCGGNCITFNGGATCINAPGTQCLSATHNVGFCDRGGCGGSCNQFSTCGTRLDNNFCFTPGTASILVGNA